MTIEQKNLEYVKRISSIMAEIAAKHVSIALLDILFETSDGSVVTDQGIIGRIRVRYGESAFSDSEVFSGLSMLDEQMWMVKRIRPSEEEISKDLFSPSWYGLTDFGRDVANFFKGMKITLIELDRE